MAFQDGSQFLPHQNSPYFIVFRVVKPYLGKKLILENNIIIGLCPFKYPGSRFTGGQLSIRLIFLFFL
jgi:hypothetical protein